MKKIKWQKKFRDLPEIPEVKNWKKDGLATEEQEITYKLITGQKISIEEVAKMDSLVNFYVTLYNKLDTIDFSSFTKKDFEDFRNYIFYAFNYILLISNKVTIFFLFRAVINRDNKTITKKGLLTYPPLHIVQKINKYNRANTPNTNVFYGSETINTAINELKPKVGDKVTVGVWKPIDKKRQFLSYPISHGANSYGVNENATSAMEAMKEFKKNTHPILARFMDPYFHLLGREFEKSIKHHYEYQISAMVSEKILEKDTRTKDGFNFECIIYPSVGNKFTTSNFAFRKDVIRHHFELSKVVEFEVASEHYDREQSENPSVINIIGIKNVREAKAIIDNDIIW